MDREKVIKGLQIERECVSRDCDRDCGKCDLVQDRDWLLSVYDDALAMLKEQEEEIQSLRRENHDILTQFHEWAKEQPQIVRCKDCYLQECEGRDETIVCDKDGSVHPKDWFCADGEEREVND